MSDKRGFDHVAGGGRSVCQAAARLIADGARMPPERDPKEGLSVNITGASLLPTIANDNANAAVPAAAGKTADLILA